MTHDLQLPTDPMDGLLLWLKEAEAAQVAEANAMTLSTASVTGQPSARIVYFKGFSHSHDGTRAPRFFTNYESQKSQEIAANPHVSLLFYWPIQWRQVRVEGRAERVSYEESNEYFQTRARCSQIGAWASPQSQPIADRAELEERVKDIERKFAGQEILCPPFWGGWRVVPERIEFWQGGDSRLHDRHVFERTEEGWKTSRLAP